MQIPRSPDEAPATFTAADARRVVHDVAPPPPTDDDEPPAGAASAQRDVLQALVGGAGTTDRQRERDDPQDHVITEADLGRTLGDVAYELAMGNLPPMSPRQQRLLTDLLFEKGYAEREFNLPMGFSLAFRTSTTALAAAVKAHVRRQLREAAVQESAREATAAATDADADNGKAERRRRPPEGLSNPEFMLLTNRITVAAQLVRFAGKPTCDEALPFASDEALAQRVAFVLHGAYDGQGVQAVLLDHMALLLNSFNDEVNQLVAGKYLDSF